ncbi:hypothetical protein F4778DRAFT_764242 [Xylariomycetidae sp. FL2044]|nr:hypothetical protein F4778DRAFT_764242 [Xylariomycetidae sp. FL2044]
MPSEPTLSPANVLSIASELRRDGTTGVLCHGTEVKPFDVGNGRIYAVRFPDDEVWAVRIPWYAVNNLKPGACGDLVQDEMDILKQLEQSGFRWSPRLIGGDTTCDNAIGYPYIVLTWIYGRPLEWASSKSSLNETRRESILRQLIDIQLELVHCTQTSSPDSSTLRYLHQAIDGQIHRVASGELHLDPKSCLVHRALAWHAVLHQEQDPESSMIAITHNNLAAHKIIVDEDHNITGIIDWKLARFRPVQLALRLPRLLNADISDIDLSASTRTASPPSNTSSVGLRETFDRQYVISYLATLESLPASRDPTDPFSLAPSMKEIVADPNDSWRGLIFESCFSKGLHSQMNERSWLLDILTGDLGRLRDVSSENLENEGMKY